jgi:glycosyltransferase involved in cell wall biosynthesis
VSRPIRTVLFSTLYPSAARPIHGIFVETRLRELLSTGAVQTRVVAPVPWFPSTHERFGEYGHMARTPRREQRHGVEVRHPRYLLLPKIGMNLAPLALAISAAPAMQALIDEGFDFDLIDAHYYYPDGVAAALLARHFRKPLAITARGTDLNLIPQHALPRRMIRWAAGRAEASIGVCAALVDVLRGWGIADSRLHVMRNGVDLRRFHPEPPAAARLQLGIEGAPVLLSVGHLIERKGHHLLIGALPMVLQRHPQARLLIVGEGPERASLEAQVIALGLQSRVTLTGALPNDTLATWYSAADVLILASSREGWANVLLEAMACGTPVVATRIWGTPEVVSTDDVGLLVEQRSSEGLAASLLQMLESPRDRGRVRRYAEGFGWEQTSQAQVSLFRELVQSREVTAAHAAGAGHA